ncbi:MAG: hypothetical protein ABFS19_12290 [Thermodesulfobacteriota bacterium]
MNREQIHSAITYLVAEKNRSAAFDCLKKYDNDRLGQLLLDSYYTALPEVSDEGVERIALVGQKESGLLFCLSSTSQSYLYLIIDEEVSCLGRFDEGVSDPDILHHFGYRDKEQFFKSHSDPELLEEYLPLAGDDSGFCPVCRSRAGQNHSFGCPVEICPWCEGQFKQCHCRFDQLGVEAISDETQLEELEGLLEKKGRIPYGPDQRLSYPSDEEK